MSLASNYPRNVPSVARVRRPRIDGLLAGIRSTTLLVIERRCAVKERCAARNIQRSDHMHVRRRAVNTLEAVGSGRGSGVVVNITRLQ